MQEFTTILDRVENAKSFVNGASAGYWLALGGSKTPWVDDNNPPMPDPTITTIPELHGLNYIDMVSLVAPTSGTGIYTEYGNYTAYDVTQSDETLIDNKAYNVYLAANVIPTSEAVGVVYRLLGLCTDVVFDTEVTLTRGEYVRAQFVTSYKLRWIAAISESTIASNQTTSIQLVRTF